MPFTKALPAGTKNTQPDAALGQSVAQEWPSCLKGQQAVLGHSQLPVAPVVAESPLSPFPTCHQASRLRNPFYLGTAASSTVYVTWERPILPGVPRACSHAVPSAAPVTSSILSGLVQQVSGGHTISGVPRQCLLCPLRLALSSLQLSFRPSVFHKSCGLQRRRAPQPTWGSHGATLSSSRVHHRLPV